MCSSCGVRSSRVSSRRLRTVSPVASSSCRARSAKPRRRSRRRSRARCAAARARRRGGPRGAATRRRAGARARARRRRRVRPRRAIDSRYSRSAASPSLSSARTRASIPSAQSVRVACVRSEIQSSASWTSAWSPVLDAASASSPTTNGPMPDVLAMLERRSRGLARRVVATDAVVERRLRVGRDIDHPAEPARARRLHHALDQLRRRASWPRHAASSISS